MQNYTCPPKPSLGFIDVYRRTRCFNLVRRASNKYNHPSLQRTYPLQPRVVDKAEPRKSSAIGSEPSIEQQPKKLPRKCASSGDRFPACRSIQYQWRQLKGATSMPLDHVEIDICTLQITRTPVRPRPWPQTRTSATTSQD
ncbi:hypothetical protein AG1IA_01962 [Rhizoctonia solani AG-1 IA]|uniref:Uncharacterized protein n=1 Tax=Thanatephorus cucumeris (strain AG1-IA) TaxID=983506 RepID=L8X5V5_THACA|nr:hypothetical protein AG1IA_01962 [Rhizoctonia solani AG-1 IA]